MAEDATLKMNGTQLYGLRRQLAALKLAFHPALKALTFKQKLVA